MKKATPRATGGISEMSVTYHYSYNSILTMHQKYLDHEVLDLGITPVRIVLSGNTVSHSRLVSIETPRNMSGE